MHSFTNGALASGVQTLADAKNHSTYVAKPMMYNLFRLSPCMIMMIKESPKKQLLVTIRAIEPGASLCHCCWPSLSRLACRRNER